MKKNILVLGYFGYKTNQLDGQTVKTRNIYQMLKNRYADGGVEYFDTQSVHYAPLMIFVMLWQLMRCNKLIYVGGANNLRYLFVFIYYMSKLFSFQIHYTVVGGWLAEYLKDNPLIASKLMKISNIFAETKALVMALRTQYNMTNVTTFPNFRIRDNKLLKPICHDNFKMVFFSRVDRMKGLDTVFYIADKCKDIQIDFYGPINKADKEYFEMQIENNSNTIYNGVLEPNDIFDTLCDYDVLILPTKYKSEGFPGAILDSYNAGVTVVVSNWNYASELVDDCKCGYICDMENPDEFVDRVQQLKNNPDLLYNMRTNALIKDRYSSEDEAWRLFKEFSVV